MPDLVGDDLVFRRLLDKADAGRQRPLCLLYTSGEARAADVGIAGGDGEGLLFRHGEILYKVPQDKLVDALMDEIDKL